MSGVVTRGHPGNEAASEQEVAWIPSPAYLDRSRLRRFMARHGIATYEDLLSRATADPGWYWGAVTEDLGLTWSRPYEQVLDLSRGAPWAEWFTGGGFNYVTSALDRHAAGPGGNRTALIWEGEGLFPPAGRQTPPPGGGRAVGGGQRRRAAAHIP